MFSFLESIHSGLDKFGKGNKMISFLVELSINFLTDCPDDHLWLQVDALNVTLFNHFYYLEIPAKQAQIVIAPQLLIYAAIQNGYN